jgi:hypothetical protein
MMKHEESDAHLSVSGEKVTGVQMGCREFTGAVKLEGYLKGLSSK